MLLLPAAFSTEPKSQIWTQPDGQENDRHSGIESPSGSAEQEGQVASFGQTASLETVLGVQQTEENSGKEKSPTTLYTQNLI